MVSRILVATDQSATATLAVDWAATMAERYQAELVVVQVIVPDTDEASGEPRPVESQVTAQAARSLEELVERLAGSRGKARVAVDPDPAKAIEKQNAFAKKTKELAAPTKA